MQTASKARRHNDVEKAAGKAEKGTALEKASRPRASSSGGNGEGISWAFAGDMLVVRIPLSRFARQGAGEDLRGTRSGSQDRKRAA